MKGTIYLDPFWKSFLVKSLQKVFKNSLSQDLSSMDNKTKDQKTAIHFKCSV